MDADDISLPERLERQVEYLERNPDIGAVGTLVSVLHPFGTDRLRLRRSHLIMRVFAPT